MLVESEFLKLPDELKLLGYFAALKKKDYSKLDKFFNKLYLNPLGEDCIYYPYPKGIPKLDV